MLFRIKMKTSETMPDLSTWMTDLPEGLHKIPLKKIAIPGSHDSFTYDMDKGNEVCKESISAFLSFFAELTIIKKIIFNWSVNQKLNVTQQLTVGMRYFDIRLAAKKTESGKNLKSTNIKVEDISNKKDKAIYCVHGMFCNQVLTYLTQIKQFLNHHTKEIVILDFNHFYNMTPQDHYDFTNKLLKLFENMVVPVQKLDELTLKTMWQKKYQVVMIYWACNEHEYLYNSDCIRSHWPEETKASKVLKVLDEEWKRPVEDKFKVYQGVLTPTTFYVLTHLRSTLRWILQHNTAMLDSFVEWVRMRKDDGQQQQHQMNVFIADFVEVDGFAQAVVNLNK